MWRLVLVLRRADARRDPTGSIGGLATSNASPVDFFSATSLFASSENIKIGNALHLIQILDLSKFVLNI